MFKNDAMYVKIGGAFGSVIVMEMTPEIAIAIGAICNPAHRFESGDYVPYGELKQLGDYASGYELVPSTNPPEMTLVRGCDLNLINETAKNLRNQKALKATMIEAEELLAGPAEAVPSTAAAGLPL